MLRQCLERPVVCHLTLICLLGTASLSSAQLTVIFDNARARPMSDFLGPLENTNAEKEPAMESAPLGAADLETLLPIRSPGLTPGKLRPRTHNVPFARPFFLIGSDEFSKSWLVKHRKALKKMSALGMLVEASSVEDLRDIARLAEGLPITPASGSDIARAIGISHYPFAISGGRIWQ
jgi:integrating conjugative element protein (TIGR03765 family)